MSVMAENKTKLTGVSVEKYFAAITDEARQKDCEALAKLMSKATGEPPKMWGTSIVGFGSYHFKYESGREGDNCVVGFSSRKAALTLYLGLGANFAGQEELRAKLGRHETAKGCLYVRSLADVDTTVLEKLVAAAAADKKRRSA